MFHTHGGLDFKNAMPKYYVGIDLGGTNLKLGLVTEACGILKRLSTPTEAEHGPDHVLERMAQAVRDICQAADMKVEDLSAVGVGAPGPLDSKKGIVIFTPNMTGWRNIHVRDRLEAQLQRPVVLENDANVAAYGEFRCGAGRSVQNMVLLTLGTGVGGGIILWGRMLRGVSDTGAELGHIIIQHGGRKCGCGNLGCLEAYASATAVVGRTKEALAAGATSSLAAVKNLTAKAVFDASAAGDALARKIFEETAEYLATGITSIIHTLNPELVVLTGGMMGAGDEFLNLVRNRVGQTAFEPAWKVCDIRWSTLGGDAGILGAALAAEALVRTGQPA
jgi:glucokinase